MATSNHASCSLACKHCTIFIQLSMYIVWILEHTLIMSSCKPSENMQGLNSCEKHCVSQSGILYFLEYRHLDKGNSNV